MSFWDFMRDPASVRILVEFGQEKGFAPAKLLAGTGLSLAQLTDPNVELFAAQELGVVGNLLRLLKDPAEMGLKVGLRYHFSMYGLWGYGLISSATAEDALALALRFLPLTYAFSVITYHEEGPLGVLSFGEPELADDTRQFLLERDMAAAAVLIHELAGSGSGLSRFTLKGNRRPSLASSRTLFGVKPEYGATSNSVVFDRSRWNQPMPQANPITVSMCEQMCHQLLARRIARVGTTKMIQQYLSASPGSQPPDLESMARMTNMSPRTLKRHLQREGASFRTLLAESRSAMAQELLKDPRLSMTDIAERLGFSDLSSFSQAFKRWHGEAPSFYRERAMLRADE